MATSLRLSLAAACAVALALSTGAAQARETSKSCHAKFTAARTAGTLGTQTYKQFKAAQCDTGTAATTPEAARASAPAASKAAAPEAATSAVMPTAIAEKYSKEAAGTARMHTCLDQYNANKATNANAGLRWIQKGGGYYSLCNARLKG
ncbi:hypothetical protein HNW77_08805 [Komagataeibacter sp. AV436]|uniref:Uncharacterized protein n=1 Tax=Komagataeibacter melomenusus TaxID=2766578 RepID=A0ABX2ADP9_9PROT|nr:hypothetical protein [Komagataeibacter melomenusus]MBV1831209.1 hypothetical protein [Komagataeibacter melomenusus]NPC66488.1 hypothetical protein [Komagataeibacter melomenusus]